MSCAYSVEIETTARKATARASRCCCASTSRSAANLAFNVDKNFSEVLDGLVLVDLRKTDPARLETYMGKEGVSRFLEHHGASVAASR
jgi:hypothetical protein